MHAKIADYMNLVVPEYIPSTLLSFFIGLIFSSALIGIIGFKLLLAMISIVFVTMGYNTYNAVYDMEIDKINKPYRPLPNGSFTEKDALVISLLLFTVATTSGFLINLNFGFIILIAIILAILYSHPIFYFRRVFVINTLIGTTIYAVLFPLAGWAFLSIGRLPLPIILILFFFGFGSAVLKDFEDLDGDRKHAINTIPKVMGQKSALRLIIACLLLSFVLLITLIALGFFTLDYAVLGIFVFLGIANARLLLNKHSKRVSRKIFLTGMLVLVLLELSIIVINLI